MPLWHNSFFYPRVNPHKVNSTGGVYSLPFGGRIRLKQNYDITGFSPETQQILQAMKKYGLILADIGSNMYVSGAPDDRWDNDALHALGNIRASEFTCWREDSL